MKAEAMTAMNVQPRNVIAVLVVHENQVLIARRSRLVAFDQGLWHCITGFLDLGVDPRQQALQEINEELDLDPTLVTDLTAGAPLVIGPTDAEWVVHPYLVSTRQKQFRLNWENDAVMWVDRDELPRDSVPWLLTVCEVVGYRCNYVELESRGSSRRSSQWLRSRSR